jgi:hypothetical protein
VPPFTLVVDDEEEDDDDELELVDPHAANKSTLVAETATNLIQLERISRFPLFPEHPSSVGLILAHVRTICNHLYILN